MAKKYDKPIIGIVIFLILFSIAWWVLLPKMNLFGSEMLLKLLFAAPLFLSGGALVFAALRLAEIIERQKKIDNEKTQFVSLVSHQLRTPMTQIRWNLEEIIEKRKLPASLRSELEQLHEMVMAENHLVGDLLNVSRIERGVLKIRTKDVAVRSFITNALKTLEKTAADKGVELHANAIPSKLNVRIDEEKAREVIRNIVDNAIRFTHKRVDISADERKKFVRISIQDQGPGIPEEDWPTIFDIKTSVNHDDPENHGAGLGLYLAKAFTEAVKGKISFASSDHGTTFYIDLPKSP